MAPGSDPLKLCLEGRENDTTQHDAIATLRGYAPRDPHPRRMSSIASVDRRTHPFAIIPNDVDDMGLDPYAFRVYARLARRAGRGGSAWESVANMAEACGMSVRKVRMSLRVLEDAGLVEGDERPGETTVYHLLDAPPKGHTRDTPAPHAGVPRHDMPPTPAPHAAKEEPTKKNPLKKRNPKPMSPHGDDDDIRDPKQLTEEHYRAFRDAWNDHRGDLPSAVTLGSTRRSKLRGLVRELGFRDALAAVALGAAEVSHDKFWLDRGYGLDNLLAGQKVIQKAETAMNRGTPDRTQAKRDELLAALEGIG